jgi:hypothetical protein
MAKVRTDKRLSGKQRQTRLMQVVGIVITIIVIITFILQLIH